MTCQLTYTKAGVAVTLAFPAGADPFAVLAWTLARMFPDADPNAPDERWDRLQARLKAERDHVAGVGKKVLRKVERKGKK